jgi:hypothetical protein
VAAETYVLCWEHGDRLLVDNDWSSGTEFVHTVRLYRNGEHDELDAESFVDPTFGAASVGQRPFHEAEDRLLARHGIDRGDVVFDDDYDLL